MRMRMLRGDHRRRSPAGGTGPSPGGAP